MDDRKFERKLWDHIESDRTVMLGLTSDPAGHSRPMTALLRLRESGFAALDSPATVRESIRDANVAGWERQLELLRQAGERATP